MLSSKTDNETINRIFDYMLKYYSYTPVDKLQRKLRRKYSALLKENKRKTEELKTLTTIDLL